MGGQVSKIMGKIFGSKEMRLLMLGLDAAGKTSEFDFFVACRTLID
jgi:ADP-ribosylation factor protein 6